MSTTIRIGIRGRLFLAFGVVAAMTVAASVVGWISYARLSDGLDRIVQTNIPAMGLTAELAETGAAITGMAPALAGATDDTERETVRKALLLNLNKMEALFREGGVGVTEETARSRLKKVTESLTANLHELDENVRRRLWYRAQKEELTERLRWSSADFLDEIVPMVDDTRFNITVALGQEGATGGGREVLRRETDKQEALYRINADGNLLVGLIGRAANLPDLESLQATELYLKEVEARVKAGLSAIQGVPGSTSLRQSLLDILKFAEGEESLFDLRREELQILQRGETLLRSNRALIGQLGVLLTERVESAGAVALAAADQSEQAMQRGRVLMLGAVVASLITAVLIVWLYVGRSMVGRIARLDGSMRAIADGNLDTDVPVEGADEIGDMGAALSTFRDRLVTTQAELVQAGKLAALGQLSAGIAHEINQPLAAIRHYARNGEKLLDLTRLDETRSNLGKISELTERVRQIISRLRSLARKAGEDLVETDLREVVQDVLLLLEGPVREADATVQSAIDPHHCWVLADQVRLEQVLLNVLSNALDAVRGQSERRIVVTARAQDAIVELSVQDSGEGIDDQHREQVFDPFFTTKEVGKGLGLGLSISYNIVKDFGGAMELESSPGEGVTVRIRLKRAVGSDKT